MSERTVFICDNCGEVLKDHNKKYIFFTVDSLRQILLGVESGESHERETLLKDLNKLHFCSISCIVDQLELLMESENET